MRRALTAVLLGCLPALAAAQEEQDTAPDPPPIVEVDDDGPIPDPNVADPRLPPDPAERPAPYRFEKRDYPRELVRRPLTLPREMIEASLDVPFVARDGHPTLHQVLRGAYGVTVDLQLGVTYGIAFERLAADDGEDAFELGKAVSLDATYTILPGMLAAQVRLAFYADPDVFGLGLILGVPFRINLGERWAIFGGADLVSIKLNNFAVNPGDPAANLAHVALVGRQGTAPSGSIDLTAGVAYQAQQNLALWGTVGLGWPDFDTNDQPFALFGGLTYTPSRDWDVGARLGFLALDELAESFSVAVFAALRL
jgi:hypothetical protein